MGRRGSLLRAFTPHHNVYSHPKKNVESRKTRRKGESHVTKNNNKTKIIKLKYNKERDEECSVDLSVSDIFDNDDENNYFNNNKSKERNIMGMSMSTANTADMSVFSPIPIRSPTPQDKQSSQFHFDFDPGISLDLGIDFDPIAALLKQSAANMNMNMNMNTKSERNSPILTDNDNATAATDTELEHVRDWTSKRLTVPAPAESQKSYHDDADPDVNTIVNEHYNEYIARKFNRERIEQYLDFICPPPTEDEDVDVKQPKQLNQELRKSLFNKQGSKSEVEKSMKSIMGFSLEAGMMGSESGKDLEFSIHDIKYDAYDNVNDDDDNNDDNNDPYLKHGFTSKAQNESRRSKLQVQIPSSINIMVEANNIDSDASTIADCSTSEGTAGIQQGSSSNKITPNLSERVQSKPDNQQEGLYPLELRKSYTHDTTTSPNGIDMFDQFINNGNDNANDNDDYNNLQKVSHNQKVNFTRVTSPQQVNFSWATNPQPPALTEQKQASKQSLTMKYDSKDALIQLKLRLQKLTPDTPSCQSPVSVMMGMSSVASPNSYKSANIMKIKSRLRNIETQYNQIRVVGVVEGDA